MSRSPSLVDHGEGAARAWEAFAFTVGMPHMVPDKLSEVELLKLLGAWQWESIAGWLGCRSSEIASASGERLYASFINIELVLPPPFTQDYFQEGMRIEGVNRVAFFAGRFVEGFAVFGRGPGAAEAAARVQSRDDLLRLDFPTAYMTNAFVARMGSNSRLKVLEPAGIAARGPARPGPLPRGIAEHQSVQSTGAIEGFGDPPGHPLLASRSDPIVYPILPESDLNGAGLLYFARYVAIMNYGERLFLSDRLERPLSAPLVACLSTERRRLYYFANADPTDSVRVAVSASLLPPGPSAAGDRRTLLKLLFRIDLYRDWTGC